MYRKLYIISTGDGKMFEQFCKDKTFGDYSGANVLPKDLHDDGYGDARLRIYRYDCAFNYTTHDVDKGQLRTVSIILYWTNPNKLTLAHFSRH